MVRGPHEKNIEDLERDQFASVQVVQEMFAFVLMNLVLSDDHPDLNEILILILEMLTERFLGWHLKNQISPQIHL